MRIIVTDVTRLDEPNVCVAGVDLRTMATHRPSPPFTDHERIAYGLTPGSILEGNFNLANGARPHVEDCYSCVREIIGHSDRELFEALIGTTVSSLRAGFGYDFAIGQKHIPTEAPPETSIITVRVPIEHIEIVPNKFNEKKPRVILTDTDGAKFPFLPLQDMRYLDVAREGGFHATLFHHSNLIEGKTQAFVRIGLTRDHQSNDLRGYWLQVNGIFPC